MPLHSIKASDKVVVRERIFIPQRLVPRKRLNAHYRSRLYKEAGCVRCPFLSERFCSECQTCPNFLGEIRFFRESTRNNEPYYELPVGDLNLAEKLLNLKLDKAKDLRVKPKMKYGLKWTGNLRHGQVVDGIDTADQVALMEEWFAKGPLSGVLQAPPRTGKTVLGTFTAVKLGLKTLILAHQEDLLDNFYKTFVRDTNLLLLRKKTGKRVVDIVHKDIDFLQLDVALCTYQKFIRAGTGMKRWNKYIKGKFGTIIVDECHSAAAAAYSRVVNESDAYYRMGLTAEPKRVDKMHLLVEKVIGPVQVEAVSVALTPQLNIWETGLKPKKDYKMWAYAMRWLFNNEERNKMIVRQVFADLRAGHRCIILPVDQLKHQAELIRLINRQAAINRQKRGEDWPKLTAVAFNRLTKDRKDLFKAIEEDKHKVIVAIRSMVKQGIDLQAPSMIYVVVPMSNPAMFYQLSNRVATNYNGKRQPEVRIMVDHMGASYGCFKKLYEKEIRPKLKQQGKHPPRYKMLDEQHRKAAAICNDRNYKATTGAIHTIVEKIVEKTKKNGKTSW